ncbi:hypothetical protein DYBT9275_00685 [Dyadobacter sp. CECT 9275]|uniref:M23ase beta-sheet core domain-containing protein n=1 Tax=Dyadobacter helix TaxID=2822344 RepID=A0A916J8G5_9BACT|nr:M23 family metallopeptidase [Dyadobacter sp. CECT 9275]CAG4991121.1 hypothetical protein DYBT9275_00685 [Dyadobacter sp. CECT 9275]
MYNCLGAKVRYFALLFFCISIVSVAQKQSYPKGYYQFPIRPGLPNSLAGGLGDLRTNHFHAGVDIRTQQREGLPVYAAADGYVLKVAVQRGGYGNVIYLRHPNGQTSVYGHLLKFLDEVGDYVRSEQYKKQTFEIDLFPQAGRYTFKKGEIIALSGNTGGSAGPHLHFEIRDSKDNYLNPLFFGFNEIKDITPPKFVNLAIRPLDINGRVNGQFARIPYTPVKQKDGSYRLEQPVTATGTIGIDLQAFDQMTGTGFRYGLQCIEIRMDGQEVFSYNMEIFPNAATRDYNNLIDYDMEQETGQRFLRCYVPDGNKFNLYKTNGYQGKLMIRDTLSHQIKIRISDSYENFSELTFSIKGESNDGSIAVPETEANPEWVQTEIDENVLKIRAARYQSTNPVATYFASGNQIKARAVGYQSGAAVFVSDLREFMPDSVQIGNITTKTYFRKALMPGIPQKYESEGWSLETDSTSLFDTLYLAVQRNYTTLKVNDRGTALRDRVRLTFKSEIPVTDKARTHMYRYVNGDYRFVGGEWKGDVITFETKELGTFMMQTDTVPPRLRLTENSGQRITGYIGDGLSGIDKFRAMVNGTWVLLNYDYKKGYIWSEKLDNGVPFDGDLLVEVTDRAGNSTILQTEIVEKPKVVRKPRKKRK